MCIRDRLCAIALSLPLLPLARLEAIGYKIAVYPPVSYTHLDVYKRQS